VQLPTTTLREVTMTSQPLEFSMKSKTLISALMALVLSAGATAWGQGHGGRNEGYRNDQSQRGDQRDDRDYRDNQGRNWGRDRNDYRRGERGERGAGPDHRYYRGDRLPYEYRNHQYVVEDWRGHRLQAPPRGYHWVQNGGDYMLVAIATGVILQLLLSN
jgi:Ni/Co efflux regulator RcnB